VIDRLLAAAASRVVLMDGGMGSSVEDRGVPVRNALWGSHALLTDEGRAINDRLHEEFVAAGAEILIANTHNASLAACADYEGSDDPAAAGALLARVNRLAVESARRAVPPGARIAVAAGVGSVEGPYATESVNPPEVVAARLAPQVRVLADLGVGLLLFETLTTATEIEGLVRLLAAEDLPPVGVGLTCGEDGRTLAGVTIPDAVATLLPAGPVAFFVQCTTHHLVARSLDTLLAAVGGRAVVGVYANDGRRWVDMRWHGDRITPEAYAADALAWRDAGAQIIGGCCGTGPEHTAAMAAALGV
jgi:homocysteine S-methyltransferase